MRGARSPVLIVAAIAAVFGSTICLQNRLTSLSASSKAPQSMTYLPESGKIRPWFLGFHSAIADFLWIQTTIYFGGHLMSDRQYPWLVHMVDIVTRLNPDFYPAYEFGGLLLPDVCKNPDVARIILQRGISAHLEKKWKFYFYLSMLYYKYYNDLQNAATWAAIAAQMPGAPERKLAGLAAALYRKSDSEAQGRVFLSFLYNTTENPEVRRYLMEKILEEESGKESR